MSVLLFETFLIAYR